MRLILLLLLVLAACIPKGRPDVRPSRPPTRPSPGIGQAAPAARPMPPLSERALRQCHADLRAVRASFQVLPDRSFGGGCDANSAVKLVEIGTPVTNLGAMRCPLALAFARWVQEVAQREAEAAFGQPLRRVESYGTYACRPTNGVAGARLSQHGHANAVDVAAFTLADGRRFTVRSGWNGPDEAERTFLHRVHDGACGRFGVVLGPDANAYHHDHFHLDMASGRYCR